MRICGKQRYSFNRIYRYEMSKYQIQDILDIEQISFYKQHFYKQRQAENGKMLSIC